MIKAITVQIKITEPDKQKRKEILDAIGDIRYQEHRALNKCITFLYADTQQKLMGKELGVELPKDTERFGKSLRAYLYDMCLECMRESGANSSVIGTTSDAANKKFSAIKTELLKGNASLPTFKRDVPIFIHNTNGIRLSCKSGKYYAAISFFNREKASALGLKNGRVEFEIINPDGSQKAVLNRLILGEYKLSQCSFNKNAHGKFMLSIPFNFEPKQSEGENVLGVDIGIHNAVAIAVYNPRSGTHKRLSYKEAIVAGGVVEDFRTQMQKRRRSYGIASKLAKGGKGYRKRNQKMVNLRQKEKNFRDTFNHKLSRYVVDEAVKHGCSLIQMEDLSGNAFSDDKFLKNWSYYDLQSKVAYKAEEQGIAFVKIKPAYTTRRCSHCGNINMEIDNTSIHEWRCPVCGKKHNRDLNAAMNISIPDIENIIKHRLELTAENVG